MIYALNATSVSIDVFIGDDTGLAVTGLVAATFPSLIWNLVGPNADNAITLADLATITTAWAATTTWGLKERGNGYYRLDIANAAFTTAGVVTIRGEATGKHLFMPDGPIQVQVPVDVEQWKGATAPAAPPTAAAVAAIPTNPLLTSDSRLNHLDADISSRLATSGYTAPDNADIATILTDLLLVKAQTDQLSFSGANLKAIVQAYATNQDPATLVLAGTVDTIAVSKILECLLACLAGVATVSGSTVTFKRRDGTTASITITYGSTNGQRTVSTIN